MPAIRSPKHPPPGGTGLRDLPLQAVEVAASLSQMVFHGLSAKVEESRGKEGTPAYVSSLSEASTSVESPPGQKIRAGEVLLLCCSVLSLLTSCILWSPHKQAWMDEIFTWKEVSDPSLWHLYYAIQHGADGGQPLFYTTAWLWARAFGIGVLALRLYSSVAMCGALLVTWRTVRRFYGMWATAFGVLFFWGTSGVLLDQNVEARFYGLYMLASRLRLTSIRVWWLGLRQHACFWCWPFSPRRLWC